MPLRRTAWSRRAAIILGGLIRTRRGVLGITVAELAERTGVERPIAGRWEAGKHLMALDTLAKVAAALELRKSDLLVALDLAGDPNADG